MFYDIFEKLCAEKKVTPAAVRAELGIGQSTMATWKSKGLTPKYDTLKKLSEYFGVSIDYLLGKANPDQLRDHAAECADNPVFARVDKALAKLNYTGQQEAVKRVEELTEIPRYQRTEARGANPGSESD